ncbi:interferon-activable protein 203 isoform X7 [Mus musculus]|uniref:Interferon activated gene 203 n=1 Tax=Mus musculus TaxID=10090 RepID=E9PUG6_MOUSE|nr:interferon-activable protein 203 isoform 3 [Mus musculus]XP_030106120.1 interferon-activable protein 203 isoform X7 [Mus musculus]|eukprot:NP_001289580.1 interferon-activable protein 203 isoform 3 [Mus musculus]
MMAEYKNIVLLKGLENMEDYQFRTVKSLLRKELKLTKKMQEDYDRIQLADWIEDKFPKDAGLDKLIKVCEHIKDLKDLAKKLKTEKAKVQKKKEGKCKTAGKKKGQDELSSSESLFNNKESNKSVPSSKKKRKQITKTEGGKKKKLTQEQAQLPETSGTNIKKEEDCLQNPHKSPPTPSSSSSNKAPRRGTVPKEPSREEGHHQGPKQVMVLKVTEPFTYDFEETKRMFHATVATETEFFRVKVFDTALMSKFIPGKIIAISHYIGCNGFLEIYRASCVSDVNINPTMIISNTLSESAIATPKISYLLSQAKGTFVNGEFVVFKKSERHECICYGIGDDTGKMAVVVYGRLTNVRCEPGSKLRLVCFELTSTKDVCLLRSVRHSYMQVINEGKPLNPDSVRRNSLEPYF